MFTSKPNAFNFLDVKQLKRFSTLPHELLDALTIVDDAVSDCIVWVVKLNADAGRLLLTINHERNRRINLSTAKLITIDIIRGRYARDLSFLVFQNGRLIDGQTRVQGCIDSGIEQEFLCIEFPPEEDILDLIDTNRRVRSASESDKFEGYVLPPKVTSSFLTINEFLHDGDSQRGASVVRDALRGTFTEPLVRVYEMFTDPSFRNTTWLSVMAMLYLRYPTQVREFVVSVTENLQCARGTILFKVREHVLTSDLTAGHRYSSACTIFNAFMEWRAKTPTEDNNNKKHYTMNARSTGFEAFCATLIRDFNIPLVSLKDQTAQQIVDVMVTVDPATTEPAHYEHLMPAT